MSNDMDPKSIAKLEKDMANLRKQMKELGKQLDKEYGMKDFDPLKNMNPKYPFNILPDKNSKKKANPFGPGFPFNNQNNPNNPNNPNSNNPFGPGFPFNGFNPFKNQNPFFSQFNPQTHQTHPNSYNPNDQFRPQYQYPQYEPQQPHQRPKFEEIFDETNTNDVNEPQSDGHNKFEEIYEEDLPKYQQQSEQFCYDPNCDPDLNKPKQRPNYKKNLYEYGKK